MTRLLLACLRAAALLFSLGAADAAAQPGIGAANGSAGQDASPIMRDGAAIMVHVRARDAYLAHHGALNNLSSFREGMARQLNEHFANPSVFTSEQVRAQIERELQRLLRAEPRFTVAEDGPRAAALQEFDAQFPIRIILPRGGAADPLVVFAQLRSGVTNLRPAISNSTLQRMTNDIELLIVETERKLRGLSDTRLSEINGLPRMFFELVGRSSFEAMTQADARQAAETYRNVLQGALRDLGPTPEQRAQIAIDTRGKLDALGSEIREEIRKLEREIDDVQRLMISAARSTFSRTVSENSFNYLLALFGAIFVFLLATPMLYKRFDNEVARGLLRSDFILQFSTVFVLTSAIIILGIGGLIKDDQLPVLLAGISGYVLGQLGRTRSGPETAPVQPVSRPLGGAPLTAQP